MWNLKTTEGYVVGQSVIYMEKQIRSIHVLF